MRRSPKFRPFPTTTRILTSCWLSGALLCACNASDTTEPIFQEVDELDYQEDAFEGHSLPTNLTTGEWETYRSDRAYVQALVPPMTPVEINHADPRQHRFILMRLKLSGKTPQNAPQLFEELEELRVEHQQQGHAPGTLVSVGEPARAGAPDTLAVGDSPATVASSNGASASAQHFFSSLDFIPNGAGGGPVEQEALSTLSDGEAAFYNFVDVACWDVNGTPLANMAWAEAYGAMPATTVSTMCDLTLSPSNQYEADSISYHDPVSGSPRNLYMVGPQKRGPTLDAPVVTGPVDSVGDACVYVCLSRNWGGDCDYDLMGYSTLKLPLAGCVDISPASAAQYSFDQTQIAAWAANCGGNCGQIRVVLEDVGVGCSVDANNAILGTMEDFWSSVTLYNGGDQLCWDMTGANVMEFDSSCRQVQDHVELTMNLPLPWVSGGGGMTGVTQISLTNNSDSLTPDFPCIRVTNSCLAEGTMIEMADGPVPIETIEAGSLASNPYANSGGLTVMDTAKGIEEAPMVRIQDEAGHTLLMTEKHPIVVDGRGMVQAEDLHVGDSVMTKAGLSRLVSVTREQFDGKVHNLKVGSDLEANSLKADQTVMFANGFLVGDGQIQSKYESIELKAGTKGDVRKRLPSSWMVDYKNSALQARRNKAR